MIKSHFIYKKNANSNEIQYLEGDEFHHLVKALRARENDTLVVSNGETTLFHGKLLTIEKKMAKLQILGVKSCFPTPKVHLAIANLKGQ